MDVSINGIEEAICGLDYRNEESPKSRLVRAIQAYYAESENPDSIRSIDGDRLIDIMWRLGGDPKAIRSKRKNLNAIKSSVNKDLDAAWENGRNPEGVTIGPENNFIMSDAAKDKILNSFSGSMNLDGGGSLDRVAEALKIVSDFLSEMPEGIENEQIENLKSIVEGLSDKIGEGGGKEFEIVEKKVTATGGETEAVDDVDSQDDIEELDEIKESDEEDEIIGPEDEIGVEEYEDEADEVEEIEDDTVELVEDDDIVDEADGLLEQDTSEMDEIEAVDDVDSQDDIEELDEIQEPDEEDEILGPEDEIDAEEYEDEADEVEEIENLDEIQEPDEENEILGPEDEIDVEEYEDEGDEVEEIDDDTVELVEDDEVVDEEDEPLEQDTSEMDEIESVEDDVVEIVEDDEVYDGEEALDGDDVGAGYEDGDLEDTEFVEIVDGEDIDGEGEYHDGQEEAFGSGEEDVVEILGAEGLADADEVEVVYEDDMGDGEEDGFGEGEDEGDDLEIADEEDEEVETEEDFVEFVDGDDAGVADELEAAVDDEDGDEEFVDEEIVEEAIDDIEEADAFEDDESDTLEGVDDDDELPDEVEEVVEGGDDVVEIEGAEGLGDVDEVEIMDGEDLVEAEDDDFIEEDLEAVDGDEADDLLDEDEYDVEEVEEGESDKDDGSEEGAGQLENGLGLPIDQLMDSAQNFEEFQLDGDQKRLLAEQFDGYLGAMERFYNQYLLIKKGSYPVGAEKPGVDVLPEQKVLLSDYYMGKYPVTNALFEVFVERTGYRTTAEKLGYGYVYHGRFRKVTDPATGLTRSVWNPTATREKVDGATWYQPLGPGSTLHKKRNHPVVQVSIRDARTFAAWTGKRLPTEIEWEAAARNMAGNIRPWGNEWMEGACNIENSGVSDTSPVDAYPLGENETGMADLMGNVMEWTGDECEPKYQLENPGKYFIAKGGSWISPQETFLYDRSRFEVDFTANILGFRCIAD